MLGSYGIFSEHATYGTLTYWKNEGLATIHLYTTLSNYSSQSLAIVNMFSDCTISGKLLTCHRLNFFMMA